MPSPVAALLSRTPSARSSRTAARWTADERGDVGRDEDDRAVVARDGSGQLGGRRELQRLGAVAGGARPVQRVLAQRGPQRVVGLGAQPRAQGRLGRRGEGVEDDRRAARAQSKRKCDPTGASSARATCGSAAASVAANAFGLASTSGTRSSTGATSSTTPLA